MRVVHLLRKYNPAEWGGTETAICRLFSGLRENGVESDVYCPWIPSNDTADPLAAIGCRVKRFRACVPIWGLSPEKKQQMIAVGGNLMSFDLIRCLWREKNPTVIHSHTLGRIGGIGLTAARRRGIPFVLTIHGGVYDLPSDLRESFATRPAGWEWGKLFGWLLRSRRILDEADAIITCNAREAELMRERHPGRKVLVQPHGIPAQLYREDHRAAARAAFPIIRDRQILLAAGRIDPVKNQAWLVQELPELLRRHPRALLVLAGPCTHAGYGETMRRQIEQLGLAGHVLLTGGLPPGDPRLIGLLQEARAIVLPSISETFGLVVLEAWAAETPVITSRTSGGTSLVEDGRSGRVFDLERPSSFHAAVDQVLSEPEARARFIEAGRERVVAEYDTRIIAGRMVSLYEQLGEEKHALRHTA